MDIKNPFTPSMVGHKVFIKITRPHGLDIDCVATLNAYAYNNNTGDVSYFLLGEEAPQKFNLNYTDMAVSDLTDPEFDYIDNY